MQDMQTVWYRAVLNLPCDAMRVLLPAFVEKDAISERHGCGSPDQAS
jgi:hypothetical protein